MRRNTLLYDFPLGFEGGGVWRRRRRWRRTDQLTDQPTNQPTDQRTEPITNIRDARTHLKKQSTRQNTIKKKSIPRTYDFFPTARAAFIVQVIAEHLITFSICIGWTRLSPFHNQLLIILKFWDDFCLHAPFSSHTYSAWERLWACVLSACRLCPSSSQNNALGKAD